MCAFLLRKVAANRASKSLISGLANKTPGLPGQRGGAGKCGHVWELWAQGLECAGQQSTGPVGAFGRVKNARLEHEHCVLKQRETQEHRKSPHRHTHFEAAQEKEGQAQLAQNKEHTRGLKPASHMEADLGDWDVVTQGWGKMGQMGRRELAPALFGD